jgi:predicted GH43/DUF377 family glycosyl hydrolase
MNTAVKSMLLRFLISANLIFILFIFIEPFTMHLIPYEYDIPSQTDWMDYGTIFEAGDLGEWDYQLYGCFANSVIKKDGIFYLYYQGASGYRSEPDDTVTWRAIGVATSQDGINFTKATSNPVLTWFPNENGEEGAVSAGTALDVDGNIVIHYGANSELDESSVNADARVAVSSNGIDFSDIGIVLKHDDPMVWGSGDEIFPILSIHDNGQWMVYYLPNGVTESGKLGVGIEWLDGSRSFLRPFRFSDHRDFARYEERGRLFPEFLYAAFLRIFPLYARYCWRTQ